MIAKQQNLGLRQPEGRGNMALALCPAPEFGVLAVALARRRGIAQDVCGGASGPAQGKRDEGPEQTGFAQIIEACVLKFEASGLGIAEQTHDRPAFVVGFKSGARHGIIPTRLITDL